MVAALHKFAVPADTVIVKYTKQDRAPMGCYGPGDVAGFAPAVAERLIKQGFAVLHDAGNGPGKLKPDEITPGQEEGESFEAFSARHFRVTGKLPPQPKKG